MAERPTGPSLPVHQFAPCLADINTMNIRAGSNEPLHCCFALPNCTPPDKNCCTPLLAEILAFMPSEESAAGPADARQQQQQQQPETAEPLPQKQVEAANRQPGLKLQKLVTALWNLDRIDQHGLPLNRSFIYGSTTAAGTGEWRLP